MWLLLLLMRHLRDVYWLFKYLQIVQLLNLINVLMIKRVFEHFTCIQFNENMTHHIVS